MTLITVTLPDPNGGNKRCWQYNRKTGKLRWSEKGHVFKDEDLRCDQLLDKVKDFAEGT